MTAIIGIGMTPFGPQLVRPIDSFAREAIRTALADADIDLAKINSAYFANALGSILFGDTTLGQSICARLGLGGIPVVNVENACTSGSTAFHLAQQAIAAGQCDLALVVGVEKMCVPGFGLINSGESDLDTQLGMVTPVSFALRAQRHMHEFGTTPAQLAQVAVKSRQFAALNPLAQFRKTESLEQVLTAPMIVDPLTRSQCCPIADGAAALVLASDKIAAAHKRAVYVRHSQLSSGTYKNPADMVRWDTDYAAAASTYEAAGVGPEDLDLVECHDAFSIAEILHYEALQLCEPGAGGELVEQGATGPGGRIPVNPSGGLLSRGHPIAATGVAQLVEVSQQLRQEAGARQVAGARLGLAHCMGGDQGGDTKSCTIAILEHR
jgi:acetyl-CoA acetyltransferase